MRVLVDRVVPGVEGERADRVALAVGDLGGRDDARRVARARRRDGAVERLRRRVAQRDDGRRRLQAAIVSLIALSSSVLRPVVLARVYSSRNASVSNDFIRSKNSTPFRWSVSCWTTRAGKILELHVDAAAPSRSKPRTRTRRLRGTLPRMSGMLRQPSQSSTRSRPIGVISGLTIGDRHDLGLAGPRILLLDAGDEDPQRSRAPAARPARCRGTRSSSRSCRR